MGSRDSQTAKCGGDGDGRYRDLWDHLGGVLGSACEWELPRHCLSLYVEE